MEDLLFKLSVMLVPGMLAVVCHEVSHGFIAWRFGDPTARMMGRLTLNPIKHIDIIGTLMIFIIGIGWAKPVPVVYENLHNPKRDMIWVAAAGPITNILLATLSAFVLRGVLAMSNLASSATPLAMVAEPVVMMLAFSVYINLLLAIFNMIPVPPGWWKGNGGAFAVPPGSRLVQDRALWHGNHHPAGVLYQCFFVRHLPAAPGGSPSAGRAAEQPGTWCHALDDEVGTKS